MLIANAPMTSIMKILSDPVINHIIGSSAKINKSTLLQDFLFFVTLPQKNKNKQTNKTNKQKQTKQKKVKIQRTLHTRSGWKQKRVQNFSIIEEVVERDHNLSLASSNQKTKQNKKYKTKQKTKQNKTQNKQRKQNIYKT